MSFRFKKVTSCLMTLKSDLFSSVTSITFTGYKPIKFLECEPQLLHFAISAYA